MLEPDVVLTKWSTEEDPDRALALLDTLIVTHAEPLIRRIVGYKLRSVRSSRRGGIQQADIDDVCQKAILNLIGRLDRMKLTADRQGVRNFGAYVASTARNASHEYFRAKNPAWHRLALKLRYLGTSSPRFALWETSDGQDVFGLARDRGRAPAADLTRVRDPGARSRQTRDPSGLPLHELTETILRTAGGPVPFEVLVDVVAEWSDLQEPRLESLDADRREDADAAPELPDTVRGIDRALVERAYMQQLWSEICSLPLEQRKALLFNLNDSLGGGIEAFDYLGIATVEQIGESVEMDPVAFAGIWNDFPLSDARIAGELGISIQAVANRRSSARQRLARRMRSLAG